MSQESWAVLHNEATPLKQNGADEHAQVDAGDKLNYVKNEETKLGRIELRSSGKLDEGSTAMPSLQSQDVHPSSTGDKAELSPSRDANFRGLSDDSSGGNDEVSNRQDPEDNHDEEESSTDPVNDHKYGVGGAFGLVVTVVRADRLSNTTSKGVFRTARKSKSKRWYVRANLSFTGEGQKVFASAVTSSVPGDGSECRWGNEESGGEVVFLSINPDALEGFRTGEDNSLAGIIEKYCELGVETWSDQSVSGESDIMLGRGKLPGQYIKYADGGDSRWVMLSLDGNAKGRVEIFVSVTTTPPRATIGESDQPSKHCEELVLASNIQRETHDNHVERKLTPQGNNMAHDDTDKNIVVRTNGTQDACDQDRAKPRPPKWGLLHMPHFQNTLNASLMRAPRRGTTAQTMHTHAQSQPQDNISQEEESDDSLVVEEGTAPSSVVNCEPEHRLTIEKKTLGNNSRHGKHVLFGARHGMQLLKESLQAKLAGASGKTGLERDSDQDETEDDAVFHEDDGERCENDLAHPPARSGSTPLSRNDMHPLEHGPDSSTMLGESESRAFYGEVADDSTREARMDGALDKDGDTSDIVPVDNPIKERAAHQTSQRDSLTEGDKPDKRRVSDRHENFPTPLKSLLRGLGGSRRAATRDERGQDGGSESVDNTPDSFDDSATAESGQAYENTAGDASTPPVALAVNHQTAQRDSLIEGDKPDERRVSDRHESGPSPLQSLLRDLGGSRRTGVGHESGQGDGSEGVDSALESSSDSAMAESGKASAPQVALAVMAAAEKLKTTLSSPALAATLKGFGWSTQKEAGEDNASPAPTATGDPTNGTVPGGLPHAADDKKLKDHCDGEVDLSGDGGTDPPSSSATLLVTIFRADGLPENLTKGNFGRTKKDATQDPYVRLGVGAIARVTSTLKGGGSKCRWGKNKGGELVELPLASADVLEGKLESVKLFVEVWNQESEGRDRDILLGRTEIVLDEWLGKIPAWTDLEIKRKQRGRVKLSVRLKGPQTEANENVDASNHYLHQITRNSRDTLAATEEQVAGDANSAGGNLDAPRKSSVGDVFQSNANNVAARKGSIGATGAAAFAEHHPVVDSLDVSCLSDGPPTDVTDGRVPHLQLEDGSFPSSFAHREAPAENGHCTSSSAVSRDSDAADRAPATGKCANSGENVGLDEGGGGLRVNTNDRSGGAEVVSLVANATVDKGDNGGKTSGVKSTVIPEIFTVTVLVAKAQSLPVSFSKTTLGRPKPNATRDPYCVLSICGSKEATLAVIEEGSASHQAGADGESVSLVVSHADLTAAGWGHSQEEGPHLTVELWNQESASRQEDVFIGSADVPLKDFLGSGAKWVELSRRRKSRVRVEIVVNCPPLQQGMLVDASNCDIDLMLPQVKEATVKEEGTVNKTGPMLSELSEVEQNSEIVKDFGTERDQQTRGNTTENIEQEPGEGAGLKLCGEEACNGARDDVADSTPGDKDMPLVPVEATPIPQSAGSESVLFNVGFVDCQNGATQSTDASRESTTEKVGKCVNEVHEDQYVMNDAGAQLVVADGKLSNPSEATKPPIGETTSGLYRRAMGGTATTLDAVSTTAASIAVRHPSIQGETAPSDAVATTQFSPENLSKTSDVNELQPSEALHESSSTPPRFEHRGRNSDTDIMGEDRLKQREFPVSVDCHTDVIEGNSSVAAGGQRWSEESCTSDTLHDKTSGYTRGQQGTTKLPVHACDKPVAMNLDDTTKAQRLERAREIARRRRETASRWGPIGSCRPARFSSGLQSIELPNSVTSEQVRIVSTIQRYFRGRVARRHLRGCQRAVVKIQASFRGHVGRRHLLGLAARTKRAWAEERRARARRARITSMQQELNLLRSTPAQQLLRIDALRATAMARRIQLFWRRHSGRARFRGADTHSTGTPSHHFTMDARKPTITAPEIKWYRSNRTLASGMTLENLQQRVAARQRVKEGSHWRGGQGFRSSHAAEQLSETERRGNTTTGRSHSAYESLVECQDNVSRLTAALHHSEPERIIAAQRRRQRLANFKTLQDQLLHPPTLAGLESTASTTGPPDYKPDNEQRQPRMSTTPADKNWTVEEEPMQKIRAQRAHALAVTAARAEGRKWWATTLPADVGYDECVDIRRVLPAWPKSSVGRGERLDYLNGFVRCREGRTDNAGDGDDGGFDFNSDEASLWWYTYACTATGDTLGSSTKVQHDSEIFAAMMERAKTSPVLRREDIERKEEARRLDVERNINDIVGKVNHRMKVARCPSLSWPRGCATAAQCSAAVVLQACFRGFLGRKKTAVLRAEMRVFGALQVLVNELRQPELDEANAADPIQSIAVILAEHNKARQLMMESEPYRQQQRHAAPCGAHA